MDQIQLLIQLPKGFPELEALLNKSKDIFPKDFPAKLPPKLEISIEDEDSCTSRVHASLSGSIQCSLRG